MEYQDLKSSIRTHLNSAAEDFFMVGYFLRQISDKALFIKDGYKSIWEFAKGEYNLSMSSASRFMAINARFSIDGGEHMAEKYIGMGVSKLQEMLGLPDEELEKVTQETTVREIRAMKAAMKEPLSFFGLPKTIRPESSLITTPGCGDGKYDCVSCSRSCSIRQELRQCVVSTCGNPKPCSLIGNEEWQRRMAYSLHKDQCQMLHHELAPIREGDKEPSPCCRNCQNKTCFNRCDIAKAEDEEAKKNAQTELRKQQKEAEAKKPEPSNADIKAFYDWEQIKATDNITAAALKDKLRNACGGGGNGLRDFRGSARGIRINYKREITWSHLAKRLKEIQEKELLQQEKEEAEQRALDYDAKQRAEKEPDIIDADFREVEDEPVQEPEELQEAQDEPQEPEEAEELQEQEAEAEPEPEQYNARDIKEILRDHEADLKAYREVGGLPEKLLRNQRILVDALTLLLHETEQREIEVEEDEDD